MSAVGYLRAPRSRTSMNPSSGGNECNDFGSVNINTNVSTDSYGTSVGFGGEGGNNGFWFFNQPNSHFKVSISVTARGQAEAGKVAGSVALTFQLFNGFGQEVLLGSFEELNQTVEIIGSQSKTVTLTKELFGADPDIRWIPCPCPCVFAGTASASSTSGTKFQSHSIVVTVTFDADCK